MNPNETDAYNIFLHTGKVDDYLNYVDARQQAQGVAAAGDTTATGANGAYYDRRNRAAGTGG